MMTNELKDLTKQCLTSLYTCAGYVGMYMDVDEKGAEFSKLKSIVGEYCMFEAQNDVANEALEKAKMETDPNNLDTLQNSFNMYLNRLAKESVNVSNHSYMMELNKRIEKSRQKERQNLDESDLAITESQEHYIDPITKRPIVDPVKNNICGHIYEKNSIVSFIAMGKRRKCPVVGCGNPKPLMSQHLTSDEEMKFRFAATHHSTMIQEREISHLDLDDTLM